MNKIFQTYDDLYIFKVLRTVLESENRKQIVLNTDSTVIENKPDIILLDLIKPFQKSVQIINNIKSIFTEIPVVIMASQQQFQDKLGVLNKEFLDHFYHEIRRDELLSWMKDYLHCHPQFEQTLFYENLIMTQLCEIMGNWKTTIGRQVSAKANTRRDIYLDALFLFNQSEQFGQEALTFKQSDDQNSLEQTLVNVVEFCPECFRYDVRLNYVCPKCESKQLEINFSHQYANLSFTCGNCNLDIEAPHVQGFCFNCNRVFDSEKVIKQKIYKYQASPEDRETKTSMKNIAPKSFRYEKPINSIPVTPEENNPLITQRKYSTNFLLFAFHENKIPYLSRERFESQMSREIDLASLHQSDVSVLSIGIANFDQVLLRFNSHVIINIFKSILTVATEYLRPSDILSLDEVHQKLLVLMPNTHHKIAKIIAKRILQKFERFQGKFLVEVFLASYPQDGKTTEEVLEIMNMGLEKVSSDFLGESR